MCAGVRRAGDPRAGTRRQQGGLAVPLGTGDQGKSDAEHVGHRAGRSGPALRRSLLGEAAVPQKKGDDGEAELGLGCRGAAGRLAVFLLSPTEILSTASLFDLNVVKAQVLRHTLVFEYTASYSRNNEDDF